MVKISKQEKGARKDREKEKTPKKLKKSVDKEV